MQALLSVRVQVAVEDRAEGILHLLLTLEHLSDQPIEGTTFEFGPDGLYHNTVGVPGFDGTTAGIPIASKL